MTILLKLLQRANDNVENLDLSNSNSKMDYVLFDLLKIF